MYRLREQIASRAMLSFTGAKALVLTRPGILSPAERIESTGSRRRLNMISGARPLTSFLGGVTLLDRSLEIVDDRIEVVNLGAGVLRGSLNLGVECDQIAPDLIAVLEPEVLLWHQLPDCRAKLSSSALVESLRPRAQVIPSSIVTMSAASAFASDEVDTVGVGPEAASFDDAHPVRSTAGMVIAMRRAERGFMMLSIAAGDRHSFPLGFHWIVKDNSAYCSGVAYSRKGSESRLRDSNP